VKRESLTFDTNVPLAQAETPPKAWYSDPEFLRAEQEKIFNRRWLYVARVDMLDGPHSYVCADLAGSPIVLTRDEDGALRALANSCRHHGTRVAEGCGHAKALTCPYHGWSYAMDGRLLRAPDAGGIQMDRDEMGLPKISVDTFGPLIFCRATAEGPTLAEYLGPIADRIGPLDGLRFFERRTYAIECNWKVFSDNYLDGGYHIAHLHRDLADQLSLESYRTELVEHGSIQTCGGDDPRIGNAALYAYVFPNLMMNRYGRCLDINLVRPTGPETCEVTFDWYFEDDRAGEEIDRAASVLQSERVQLEDIDISKKVQEGLRSRFYERGRYAPSCEIGMYQFHSMLARDLAVRGESAFGSKRVHRGRDRGANPEANQ